MYIPKYFIMEELLPQEICNPQNTNLWFLLDSRILLTADMLRGRYGPIRVNTWHWQGTSQYRGYRPYDCQVGSHNSQHKFGRALDLIPLQADVEEIRQEIIDDPFREEFKYITAIEKDVSWLHIDCRNYDKDRNGLLIFGKS